MNAIISATHYTHLADITICTANPKLDSTTSCTTRIESYCKLDNLMYKFMANRHNGVHALSSSIVAFTRLRFSTTVRYHGRVDNSTFEAMTKQPNVKSQQAADGRLMHRDSSCQSVATYFRDCVALVDVNFTRVSSAIANTGIFAFARIVTACPLCFLNLDEERDEVRRP